jgi:hypothetical protein
MPSVFTFPERTDRVLEEHNSDLIWLDELNKTLSLIEEDETLPPQMKIQKLIDARLTLQGRPLNQLDV